MRKAIFKTFLENVIKFLAGLKKYQNFPRSNYLHQNFKILQYLSSQISQSYKKISDFLKS